MGSAGWRKERNTGSAGSEFKLGDRKRLRKKENYKRHSIYSEISSFHPVHPTMVLRPELK